MSNRPSFQFYPNDWLSSTNIMLMTASQEGAYIRLLAIAWNSDDCGLDNDLDALARLGRIERNEIERVLKNFTLIDGRWFNDRLLEEREKQDKFRENAIRAGKASAEKRINKTKSKNEQVFNGRSTGVQRNGNSSSSISSSNNKEINKEKKEEVCNPYWDSFKGVCFTKNIEIDATEKRYMELHDEYSARLNFFKEAKSCVEWCYDNGLRKINIQRLRNWMKNVLKFQKEKEIKLQQQFQDKKFAPQKPIKQSPVWRPPIDEMDDLKQEEVVGEIENELVLEDKTY